MFFLLHNQLATTQAIPRFVEGRWTAKQGEITQVFPYFRLHPRFPRLTLWQTFWVIPEALDLIQYLLFLRAQFSSQLLTRPLLRTSFDP